MSFKNDKSLELIHELLHTHSVIGYEKTKSAITCARDIGDQYKNERLLQDFILKECCNVFRIPQKKLLTGKAHGDRTDCLMVLFAMVKKNLPFSNLKIGITYKKSATIVTRAIGRFNSLKETDKNSAKIIVKSKKINDAIILFKETLYK